MNYTINQQLDIIFEEWSQSCNYFIKDGLMLKPDATIDVNNAWIHSDRRIAFLLKDQNQGNVEHWDEDARLWPTFEGWAKGQLFHIIANSFYGLSHIDCEDYNQVWFGELNNSKVIDYFNRSPFAFIECKKEPGESTLNDSKLRQYLTQEPHSVFLSKEIKY